jgi:hypothetical protein
MKKTVLNEEFKRMQKLAGIINEDEDYDDIEPDGENDDWKKRDANEGQQVADFLNQHKEEVFEKLFDGYSNPNYDGAADGLNIDEMTDWEELSEDNYTKEYYICAQTDFPTAAVGSQARFTPFPPDALDVYDKKDSMGIKTNIAGKTIYYHIFVY